MLHRLAVIVVWMLAVIVGRWLLVLYRMEHIPHKVLSMAGQEEDP